MGTFQIFLQLLLFQLVASETNFVYNGFSKVNLSLYGASHINSQGLLRLTDDSYNVAGHALYPYPLCFKENTTRAPVVSFSTTFIISISPKYPLLGGHGLTFALLSTKASPESFPNKFLGLPNLTTKGEHISRTVAVEFDIVQNLDLGDINDNHVGIDIGSLISNISQPAAYYTANYSRQNQSISLKSGDPVHAWIDYTSKKNLITVTLSPLGTPRPVQPLLSLSVNLSLVLEEYMYVGFSASTGMLSAMHNVLAWSFRIGETAQDLDLSGLPSLVAPVKMVHRKGFAVGITLSCITLVLLVILGVHQVLERRKHGDEILEEWEIEYRTRSFKYPDLLAATKGFSEKNLIGSGGFGGVFKGVIPGTDLEVAIKRIAHDSRQGMREFVAEIMSMGRLRHRNLVQLHGWCRYKDELLLVYEYFTNGSLDKLLSGSLKKSLNWDQRYKILIGVAQALLYLHEEFDQRVVHRDIKPSNILLDADLNAKLGDFGLARIYEHGINSQTTHIVGTLGYLAPELTRTGQATTSTDVYAYGALMLEVACGRRPIDPQKNAQELVLVDWVRELHARREILRAMDTTMDVYSPDEAEIVLSIGMLCSHPLPSCRPSMRKVVQYLLGDAHLPELPPDIHLELPGALTNACDIYLDNSNPSSSTMTPSKISSSFTSIDKKFVAQYCRATY